MTPVGSGGDMGKAEKPAVTESHTGDSRCSWKAINWHQLLWHVGMLPGRSPKQSSNLPEAANFSAIAAAPNWPNFSGAERCLERYLSKQPAAKSFSVTATRQPPGEHNAFPSLN
mmetsp:Transcript_33411/g.53509  ORF Transcript_33411/g.53509 Transcript_33411/m.53509 type:complete len:114 (-) Transcript_33411:32-373(-)